jgi:hypothetical protein
MNQAQVARRIALLEGQLNNLTARCPIRFKVALVAEIRALKNIA